MYWCVGIILVLVLAVRVLVCVGGWSDTREAREAREAGTLGAAWGATWGAMGRGRACVGARAWAWECAWACVRGGGSARGRACDCGARVMGR